MALVVGAAVIYDRFGHATSFNVAKFSTPMRGGGGFGGLVRDFEDWALFLQRLE